MEIGKHFVIEIKKFGENIPTTFMTLRNSRVRALSVSYFSSTCNFIGLFIPRI